jgi:hypothetical protein
LGGPFGFGQRSGILIANAPGEPPDNPGGRIMTAIAELSKSDLAARWKSAQNRLARFKEQGESVAKRGMLTLSGLAGGATDGLIRGLWGDPAVDGGDVNLPGTEIQAVTVLGTLASGLSAIGGLGEVSDYGTAYSIGLLAPVTSREVESAVRTAMKPKTTP